MPLQQRVEAATMLHRAVVAAGAISSRFGVLPDFSPISLHDLFCATSDGFRSKVLCFLLLRLPIVRSTLSGVFFCCAPILDVGLLTVVAVSCKASVQPAHSQAISCSPMPR